jgi:dTDP-4-dehydrorhamnose reductase
MRVLVLGAGGMAGHVISIYLGENGFTVDTLSAKNALDKNTHILDVTDEGKINEFLGSNKFDTVINCIGLLIKQSEDRKDLGVYLNSYFPHFLEHYFKSSRTKVIHVSTDGVFSGKNAPYKEDSIYNGESFYGRTKALGEILNDKDLTFRMSIIGPDINKDGAGLFNWFYGQKEEIQGYTNVKWNGITTIELAKAIKAAVEQDISGIYHLAPQESISKFELLKLIQDTFDLKNITLKPSESQGADYTLLNTRNDFIYNVPGYMDMISDMKTWIDSHPSTYSHYGKR